MHVDYPDTIERPTFAGGEEFPPSARRLLSWFTGTAAMPLLLACCRELLGTAEGNEATLGLSALSDPEGFLALCREHRLSLVARKALNRSSIRVPSALRQALDGEARRQAVTQLRLSGSLAEIHRAFQSCGIRYMALKGPVLNQLVFGNEILRISRDLDILIERGSYNAVDVQLRLLGYDPVTGPGEEPAGSPLYFIRRKDRSYVKPGVGTIEVHWRTDEVETLILPGLFDWDSPQAVPLQGLAIPVLPDLLHCMYLCLHAARHDWSRLRWLLDIPLFMRARGIGHEELYSLAKRYGLQGPVLEAFWLSDRLLGTDFGSVDSGRAAKAAVGLARRIRILRLVRAPKTQTLLLTFQKSFLYPGVGNKIRYGFLWALNQACSRVRVRALRMKHLFRLPVHHRPKLSVQPTHPAPVPADNPSRQSDLPAELPEAPSLPYLRG